MNPTRSLCRHALIALTLLGPATAFAQAPADEAGVETTKPTAPPPAPPPAPAAKPAGAVQEPEPATPAAAPARRRSVEAAGTSPQDTLISGQSVGIDDSSGDEWKFNFKGFFRAPMRVGWNNGDGNFQLHSLPVIPDWNYTNWQYTNANPGPWVEMLFQYGNNHVMMTTAIASYNITAGGWRELQDQLGIDRAFLTLNWPDSLGDLGGLSWNVGVFSNRYGAAGRYDAGAYETYLFGRTRIAGETLTGNIWLSDALTLVIEHGIGAKLDQQKWTARAVGVPNSDLSYQSYEPYPGPVQQGSTLLHHAHVGLNYADTATVTLHYIDTWTKDERAGQRQINMGMNMPAGMVPQPYRCDSSGTACEIRVVGADVKVLAGPYGDGYIGFSNVKATNAVTLSDSLELLHSQGGVQLTNNYFGAEGTGSMNTILAQYQFSLAALLVAPQPWWGDGADLVFKVFGMYNSISGTNDTPINGSGKQKLKLGGDAFYTPLPTLGFGLRYDLVQPDLKNSEHSFQVFSPRIVLRTRFVTHEQITIQYTHYAYKSQVVLPFPFNGDGAPFPTKIGGDKGVFTISASMWW